MTVRRCEVCKVTVEEYEWQVHKGRCSFCVNEGDTKYEGFGENREYDDR